MASFDPTTYEFVSNQLIQSLTDQFQYEQALQNQQFALEQELGGYQFQADSEQQGLDQALRNAQARAAQAAAQAQLSVSEASQRAAFDNWLAQKQGDLSITQGQRSFDTNKLAAGTARDQALRDLGLAYQDAGSTFYGTYLQRGLGQSGVHPEALRQLNERLAYGQGDARTAYDQQLQSLTNAMTGVRENAALNTESTARGGQLSVGLAGERASVAQQGAAQEQALAAQAAQEGFDLAQKEIKRRQQAAQKQFDIWKDQALGSNQFRAGIRDQQAGQFFTTQAMGALNSDY